jgi:hypothetical protein
MTKWHRPAAGKYQYVSQQAVDDNECRVLPVTYDGFVKSRGGRLLFVKSFRERMLTKFFVRRPSSQMQSFYVTVVDAGLGGGTTADGVTSLFVTADLQHISFCSA